jgi:hypothetical protein
MVFYRLLVFWKNPAHVELTREQINRRDEIGFIPTIDNGLIILLGNNQNYLANSRLFFYPYHENKYNVLHYHYIPTYSNSISINILKKTYQSHSEMAKQGYKHPRRKRLSKQKKKQLNNKKGLKNCG